MDAFKLEAFKVALFILPGIITLRIKTALSISSPSKPLNTVIDGLAFTRVDHALFGILKATLNAVCHYPIAKGIKSLAASIIATSSLPGELGQAFGDAGGFPIIVIAVVTGFVGEIDTFSEEAGNYEILLSNASQVQVDGSLLPILGEGVLLTRENPILRVDLWNPRLNGSGTSGGRRHV